MNNIEEYIQNTGQLIEKRLDAFVAERQLSYDILLRAARYSLLSAGKRLRPILTLATAETMGGSVEQALNPACALEMIHTYSLIHDDLPCMDDDDFRRGKPSLHKAFSEGHAVLTGDCLLTLAFEVMADAPFLTPQQKVNLISLLAKNAGMEGMIGGQVLDIESEGKSIDIEFLREIHERKTGALIVAAIECGAIIADATDPQIDVLRKFGRDLGFAFQVIDDVIDVISNKNSDIKNGKSTYVTLLGLEKARALAYSYYDSALKKLEELPFNTSILSSLARLMVDRNK